MELHTLAPAKGSIKKKKRIGRGQGSGYGGTSTRGHKGAKSRSGYSKKRNYEGGQTPLQMRLPKRGFKNLNRIEYTVFNVGRLQEIADKYKTDTIDVDFLRTNGFVKKTDRIKILALGTLTTKLNITAHKCSAKAQEAIESVKGTLTLIP